MPECVGVGEDEVGVSRDSRSRQLRAAGELPYGEAVDTLEMDMRQFLLVAACAGVLSWYCAAQNPAAAGTAASKGTTLIGCLAGPDADDHYTLTSMEHRLGVDVVGGDELKTGAGAKVKLTGSWEALPGSQGKGDASRRFKATAVSVMEERCAPPSPTTPVGKKKTQTQVQQKP